MEIPIVLIVTVVIVALAFDFTNGFHDAANAIATVVSTGALSIRKALVMAAFLNVVGAFFATAVAKTIEEGIITNVGNPLNAQLIVMAALGGAILWNVATWFVGMPSSSSHAIVGGLIGAGVAFHGTADVIWSSVVSKVLIPMVVSPVFGGIVAAILMGLSIVIFRAIKKEPREHLFKKLQVLAGALMAFSHGSNDAQKTMGVITLALVGAKVLPAGSGIPWWVIIFCALAMGLGTLAGGKKIIETAGKKVTTLNNESGFCANIGASITILICSRLGLPVSTTHVVIGGITGAGLASGKSVQLKTWGKMIIAWVCTLPGSAGFALTLYLILYRFLMKAPLAG